MQENRSFDSYFGTYPGADGFPKHVLRAATRRTAACVRPYHDPHDRNAGGPHDHIDAVRRHRRRDDERLHRAAPKAAARRFCTQAHRLAALLAAPTKPDVMGYHDAREIPNYWTYARHFVLAGPHVPAGYVVEPAGASLSRLGLVGALLAARQSDELRERGRRIPARRRASRRTRPARARLRLDRPHVPPAQEPRQLALLRLQAASSRTATTTRCSARPIPQEREDARHLEPAARASTRSQQDGQLENVTPFNDFLRAAPRRARCRPSRGSHRRRPVSEHPPALGQRRPGAT